ncbi:MAG: hypothetical protein GKR89_02210 [Candidatus Latescibacteria bacterium]|nr:hypothetical protein [Candidatus Latescibacterota bacterium]
MSSQSKSPKSYSQRRQPLDDADRTSLKLGFVKLGFFTAVCGGIFTFIFNLVGGPTGKEPWVFYIFAAAALLFFAVYLPWLFPVIFFSALPCRATGGWCYWSHPW